MKNKTLYNKTVDILVQAYFNDTLEHTNCYACAVGNLIAAHNGYTFREGRKGDAYYDNGCITKYIIWNTERPLRPNETATYYCTPSRNYLSEQVLRQIESTGYSLSELSLIEWAFESVDEDDYESVDEYNFAGLMNVVIILDRIHENKDETITVISKQKFKKEAAEVL